MLRGYLSPSIPIKIQTRNSDNLCIWRRRRGHTPPDVDLIKKHRNEKLSATKNILIKIWTMRFYFDIWWLLNELDINCNSSWLLAAQTDTKMWLWKRNMWRNRDPWDIRRQKRQTSQVIYTFFSARKQSNSTRRHRIATASTCERYEAIWTFFFISLN